LTGILVVERSATLCHLLKRTLSAAGINARSELSSYLEAVDHLQRSAELDQDYALLLVGAPARMTREFAALLDYLRATAGAAMPVLLMAHEKTADLIAFAEAHRHATLVLWANFSRIPGVLKTLLPEDAEPHIAPVVANAPAGDGIRILFVDDSQSVRLAYQQLLERNGFNVVTAGTIGEASEMAATFFSVRNSTVVALPGATYTSAGMPGSSCTDSAPIAAAVPAASRQMARHGFMS